MKTSLENEFISNRFFEITFQYLSSNSEWGVGASFSDNSPNYPTYLGSVDDYLKYNMLYFFGNRLHSVSALCPIGMTTCPNNWWFVYPNSPPTNNYLSSTVTDFNTHTFSAIRTDLGNNTFTYKAYLDGKLIVDTKPTTRIINSIWIGHPSNLGSARIWPTLKIYSVRSLSTPPGEFPYLSQKSDPWGEKEYDSAISWAGVDKSGINRWGCALTSTAMLLQKYQVNTTAGELVTPENLNTWLKGQPDGYIGLGYLNWLAISRFAKQSYESGDSPTKLEFERSYSSTGIQLPAIIGVPGHFVVAHTDDTASWIVNDPSNPSASPLPKTSTIRSINRFIPSQTNLSYMMFVSGSDVTMSLRDPRGQTLPVNWIDEYLRDDVDGLDGPSIRTGMWAKPDNGKYLLVATKPAEGTRELKSYLYDEVGNPSVEVNELTLPTTYFEIEYASESGKVRGITEVDLTPPAMPQVVSPVSGAHVNTNGLMLDWSDSTDQSTPVTYNYKSSWNGGSYGPVSTPNSYIYAPGTPDNAYVWQVQACDSLNNCSDWTRSELIVDSTAPTIDLVFPVPGPASNYFEATFSEPVDPIQATDSANYYLANWPGAGGSGDLAGDATITYYPSSRTARVEFINPGWYISAEQLWGVEKIHDLAGNLQSINPYSEYSTQMIAPTLSSAPVTSPNLTTLSAQTWSWLPGNDVGSGIAGYSTRIYDVVAQTYLDGWLWIGDVLKTETKLGEGQWKIALKAQDWAGNLSTPIESAELQVDQTPPTTVSNLHFDNPSLSCGDFTNAKIVTIDWDDASDNMAIMGYEYNIDYPLATGTGRGSWTTFFNTSSYRGSLNEGTHYIKIRAKDKAGLYSPWSNSCAITYDSVAPQMVSQTRFSGWYRESQTSYFDYTDPNRADHYLAPACLIETEGRSSTCRVETKVCDKAGNCEIGTRESNPAQLDFTAPTITMNSWGSTINGTASDLLSGVERVVLKITKPNESETSVTATGTNNWTYTMTDAPMGQYRVVATAYDYAGNPSLKYVKEYEMIPPNPDLQTEEISPVLGATTIAGHPMRSDLNDEGDTSEDDTTGEVLGGASQIMPEPEKVEKAKKVIWSYPVLGSALLLFSIIILIVKKKLSL